MLEFADISLPKELAVIMLDGAFHSKCQTLNINFPAEYTPVFLICQVLMTEIC